MAVEEAISPGEWFVGEDKVLKVDVLDAAGVAQNMTGWALAFSLSRRKGEYPVLSKTTVAGITIGNGAGTNDRATVTIAAADYGTTITPGSYYGSLWRTDGANDTVLWYGTVVLSAAAAAP